MLNRGHTGKFFLDLDKSDLDDGKVVWSPAAEDYGFTWVRNPSNTNTNELDSINAWLEQFQTVGSEPYTQFSVYIWYISVCIAPYT